MIDALPMDAARGATHEMMELERARQRYKHMITSGAEKLVVVPSSGYTFEEGRCDGDGRWFI